MPIDPKELNIAIDSDISKRSSISNPYESGYKGVTYGFDDTQQELRNKIADAETIWSEIPKKIGLLPLGVVTGAIGLANLPISLATNTIALGSTLKDTWYDGEASGKGFWNDLGAKKQSMYSYDAEYALSDLAEGIKETYTDWSLNLYNTDTKGGTMESWFDAAVMSGTEYMVIGSGVNKLTSLASVGLKSMSKIPLFNQASKLMAAMPKASPHVINSLLTSYNEGVTESHSATKKAIKDSEEMYSAQYFKAMEEIEYLQVSEETKEKLKIDVEAQYKEKLETSKNNAISTGMLSTALNTLIVGGLNIAGPNIFAKSVPKFNKVVQELAEKFNISMDDPEFLKKLKEVASDQLKIHTLTTESQLFLQSVHSEGKEGVGNGLSMAIGEGVNARLNKIPINPYSKLKDEDLLNMSEDGKKAIKDYNSNYKKLLEESGPGFWSTLEDIGDFVFSDKLLESYAAEAFGGAVHSAGMKGLSTIAPKFAKNFLGVEGMLDKNETLKKYAQVALAEFDPIKNTLAEMTLSQIKMKEANAYLERGEADKYNIASAQGITEKLVESSLKGTLGVQKLQTKSELEQVSESKALLEQELVSTSDPVRKQEITEELAKLEYVKDNLESVLTEIDTIENESFNTEKMSDNKRRNRSALSLLQRRIPTAMKLYEKLMNTNFDKFIELFDTSLGISNNQGQINQQAANEFKSKFTSLFQNNVDITEDQVKQAIKEVFNDNAVNATEDEINEFSNRLKDSLQETLYWKQQFKNHKDINDGIKKQIGLFEKGYFGQGLIGKAKFLSAMGNFFFGDYFSERENAKLEIDRIHSLRKTQLLNDFRRNYPGEYERIKRAYEVYEDENSINSVVKNYVAREESKKERLKRMQELGVDAGDQSFPLLDIFQTNEDTKFSFRDGADTSEFSNLNNFAEEVVVAQNKTDRTIIHQVEAGNYSSVNSSTTKKKAKILLITPLEQQALNRKGLAKSDIEDMIMENIKKENAKISAASGSSSSTSGTGTGTGGSTGTGSGSGTYGSTALTPPAKQKIDDWIDLFHGHVMSNDLVTAINDTFDYEKKTSSTFFKTLFNDKIKGFLFGYTTIANENDPQLDDMNILKQVYDELFEISKTLRADADAKDIYNIIFDSTDELDAILTHLDSHINTNTVLTQAIKDQLYEYIYRQAIKIVSIHQNDISNIQNKYYSGDINFFLNDSRFEDPQSVSSHRFSLSTARLDDLETIDDYQYVADLHASKLQKTNPYSLTSSTLEFNPQTNSVNFNNLNQPKVRLIEQGNSKIIPETSINILTGNIGTTGVLKRSQNFENKNHSINEVIDKLKNIFSGVDFVVLDAVDFLKKANRPYSSFDAKTIRGFTDVSTNTIYLNKDSDLDIGTPIHEIAHLFLPQIKYLKPTLYNRLLAEAKLLEFKIGKKTMTCEEMINKLYYNAKQEIKDEEIIVHALELKGKQILGTSKNTKLHRIIKDLALNAIKYLIGSSVDKKTINIKDIKYNTSIDNLAAIMYGGQYKINLSVKINENKNYKQTRLLFNFADKIRTIIINKIC